LPSGDAAGRNPDELALCGGPARAYDPPPMRAAGACDQGIMNRRDEDGERLMNRIWPGTLVLALLLVGPAGCGKKEIEELRARTAVMEKDLTDARARLADKDREIEELRATSEARIGDLTKQLNKAKVERDKLRQELNALKKKRKK
jgi:septal ring factor EnvC (AmiA/AmiB activator)